MVKYKVLLALMVVICTSCVQKTYERTVVYTLNVYGVKDINSVGVRGRDKPLSWNSTFQLNPIVKDSLYRAIVTYQTGYKFTEVKFVVNDEFELQDKDNRKVVFHPNDTTFVTAVFNRLK